MKTASIVHQIECTEFGPVQVRFGLLTLSDTDQRISTHYHRTVISPGDDARAVLDANNASFVAMGYPTIDPASPDWLRVVAICAAAWTPAVQSEFAAVRAEQIARAQEMLAQQPAKG